jgi:hypothetical protein
VVAIPDGDVNTESALERGGLVDGERAEPEYEYPGDPAKLVCHSLWPVDVLSEIDLRGQCFLGTSSPG